jgi:hypothetical protein
MPKITRHGGATNAADGPQVLGGAWSDTGVADEWPAISKPASEPDAPAEDEATVAVSVDGVDQGSGEVVEFTGEPAFEPLPEVAEEDTGEHVSEPDYSSWTVEQLKEELGNRGLPKTGNKPELVERLAQHDVDTADQDLP